LSITRRVLEWVVEVSTQRPAIVITVILLIAILALIPASQLKIDSSTAGFFSGDDEEIENYFDTIEAFGEQELLTIVIDSSNSTSSNAEAFVEYLASDLKENDNFRDVTYTYDYSFAEEYAILYLPVDTLYYLADVNTTLNDVAALLLDYASKQGASKEYIVSENGNIYLINMIISTNLHSVERRDEVFGGLYDYLDGMKGDSEIYSDLDVGFTGGFLIMDYEGDQMVMGDIYFTAILTFILILVVLYVSFGELSLPLMAIIPLVTGILISAGLITLIFGDLNMMSMSFAVLALGLGVDFCIHLLIRYTDEMKDHSDNSMALKHTFVHTGVGVILGCLTTSMAFFALYFGKTEAMQEMGVIAMVGLTTTLVCVFFMLPAIITLRLRWRNRKKGINQDNLGKANGKIPRISILKPVGKRIQKYAWIVVVLMLIAFGYIVIKAPEAELSKNIHEVQPTEIQTYKQLEKVKENFDYSEDFLLCTAGSEYDLEMSVGGFRGIEQVLSVESVLNYLPEDQQEKLALLDHIKKIHPEFGMLPFLNTTEMHWSDLPPSMYENWVRETDNGHVFLIRITAKGDIYDEGYRDELLSEMREVNPNITGQAIMWPRMLDGIVDDIINVSIYAVIPILLVTFIGFSRKNPLYAMLAFLPVLFGLLGVLALHKTFGIILNFVAALVMPLIIGIGIDDGIHIVHRYMEEGRGSVAKVIEKTGKAVFLTTLTTCLAFSSFIFAAHPGIQSLGRIPVLGLSLCFVASVTILPALCVILLDRARGMST
jgi:predicted RND superfamily exporter protein